MQTAGLADDHDVEVDLVLFQQLLQRLGHRRYDGLAGQRHQLLLYGTHPVGDLHAGAFLLGELAKHPGRLALVDGENALFRFLSGGIGEGQWFLLRQLNKLLKLGAFEVYVTHDQTPDNGSKCN